MRGLIGIKGTHHAVKLALRVVRARPDRPDLRRATPTGLSTHHTNQLFRFQVRIARKHPDILVAADNR